MGVEDMGAEDVGAEDSNDAEYPPLREDRLVYGMSLRSFDEIAERMKMSFLDLAKLCNKTRVKPEKVEEWRWRHDFYGKELLTIAELCDYNVCFLERCFSAMSGLGLRVVDANFPQFDGMRVDEILRYATSFGISDNVLICACRAVGMNPRGLLKQADDFGVDFEQLVSLLFDDSDIGLGNAIKICLEEGSDYRISEGLGLGVDNDGSLDGDGEDGDIVAIFSEQRIADDSLFDLDILDSDFNSGVVYSDEDPGDKFTTPDDLSRRLRLFLGRF